MMNIRVLYNVLLVRLGIRQMLPSDYINNVPVVDNGDPMVPLPSDSGLFIKGTDERFGRKQMVERLLKAAHYVSQYDCGLIIFQAYRSPQAQAERRKALYEVTKLQHPDLDEKAIMRLVNVGIAGVGGGHQTGGAVDLALCDEKGQELDMGTRYGEHNDKTASRCNLLNEEQQRNREILLTAMQRAGFVNYPAEWWHFSYGDKMWAAYRHKKYAIYEIKE